MAARRETAVRLGARQPRERRESDGTTVVHADLTEHSPAQLNDMIVDARGRCWIGQFGFDLMNGGDVELATLLRVDPDGTVAVVAENL